MQGLVRRQLQIAAPGDAFGLGRVGIRLQIVRERNDREKNRRQHRQSNQLHADGGQYRFFPSISQVGQPRCTQHDGDRNPQQIEEGFHDSGSIIPNLDVRLRK